MARILVIEDEHEVKEALRMMLEQEGHEVITASNGEEGIQIYARNPTDLIITDLLMPEKDGVETLLELRADFPDARIIAISGAEQEFLPRAKEFGAARTLSKPFRQKELIDAVNETLG